MIIRLIALFSAGGVILSGLFYFLGISSNTDNIVFTTAGLSLAVFAVRVDDSQL